MKTVLELLRVASKKLVSGLRLTVTHDSSQPSLQSSSENIISSSWHLHLLVLCRLLDVFQEPVTHDSSRLNFVCRNNLHSSSDSCIIIKNQHLLAIIRLLDMKMICPWGLDLGRKRIGKLSGVRHQRSLTDSLHSFSNLCHPVSLKETPSSCPPRLQTLPRLPSPW